MTDWLLRQLMGEKVALPAAEGRRVIRMGVSTYKDDRTKGYLLRIEILETLAEHGQMTTAELVDELHASGRQIGYDSVYSVLKKMARKGQLQHHNEASAHGGKGVSVWQVAE